MDANLNQEHMEPSFFFCLLSPLTGAEAMENFIFNPTLKLRQNLCVPNQVIAISHLKSSVLKEA